jgi:DNA modification methylase
MASIEIHPGDNRETLRRMIADGVRVHSVCTDPPYGLVSIQKRFGKEGAKSARTEKNDGSFARLSGGFMGKQWDATGIERDPEFWKLIYDILLPGGFVFAFSGSRTGHWQACAMEVAGFIMHPMHGWCFGSGFPKAHAADKAIDVELGLRDSRAKNDERYAPISPEAAAWEGWGYGTQTQKPALEPIYLAQKPFSEKTGAANLLKHGVGAFNIDGCRVGGEGGRHPANLILDGSPEVVAMFPATAGAQAPVKGTEPSGVTKDIYGKFSGRVPGTFFNDSGSAARFFHQFTYACERCQDTGLTIAGDAGALYQEGCADCDGRGGLLPDTDPLIYQGKAAKADRAGSRHPTVKPIALLRYLIRHITLPGGTVLDPFAGSGTTGAAAELEGVNCILMEAEPEYVEFLHGRFPQAAGKKDNGHRKAFTVCSHSDDLGIYSISDGDEFDDILGGSDEREDEFADILG